MNALGGIFYCAFLVCMFATIFFGIPRLMNWWELNISEDYLINRSEKRVKDLRNQIRLIVLEKEATELEKRLEDPKSVSGKDIRLL